MIFVIIKYINDYKLINLLSLPFFKDIIYLNDVNRDI